MLRDKVPVIPAYTTWIIQMYSSKCFLRATLKKWKS